jgi:hypothetical protein
MDANNSKIIRRQSLIPLTDGWAHEIMDGIALAWIFSAALSSGLVILYANRFTVATVAFSLALGGIWWTLSHLKRRRR